MWQFAYIHEQVTVYRELHSGKVPGSISEAAPDNLNAPNITQAAALFTQLKQRTEQSSSIDFDAWKKGPIMKYKEIGRAS